MLSLQLMSEVEETLVQKVSLVTSCSTENTHKAKVHLGQENLEDTDTSSSR